jgi:EPS-associated MarR family transcriptional regulator
MENTENHFEVLRRIKKAPELTQRKLAADLGFSLGKLNYCLKALKRKGLVKLKNFKKKNNKIKYLGYVITPKGISYRTKVTLDFMQKKNERVRRVKKGTRFLLICG